MRRAPQHRAPTAPAGGSLRDRRACGRSGERGAILVHVAVATMGLLAFSALSIDLGTLWVARAQAQNAADAAALAGGVSLAYIDETNTDAAAAAADAVAQAHSVWGTPVAPTDVAAAVAPCPAGSPGVAGACLRVVVSRNAASGTPLPVFFSRLFGVTGNDMHASASAKVMFGNRTSCPRPLAIVDRWNDHRDATAPVDAQWTFADDTFDRYDPTGTPLSGALDVYDPPSAAGSGSGWALSHVRPSPSLTFRLSTADVPLLTPLAADQMLSFDLARSGGQADAVARYAENLGSCGADPLALGQPVPTVYPHRERYTVDPLRALIDQDGGAYWDDAVQAVRGSAFPVSPRLITIAVIDPDHYSRQDRTSSSPTLQVSNLVGFFLEDVRGLTTEVHVQGRLARTAGMLSTTAPAVSEQAGFLRTVALVR